MYLTVELLGHFDKFMLTFLAAARLFSKAAVLLYVPTSNIYGYQFFCCTSSPILVIVFKIIIIAILVGVSLILSSLTLERFVEH